MTPWIRTKGGEPVERWRSEASTASILRSSLSAAFLALGAETGAAAGTADEMDAAPGPGSAGGGAEEGSIQTLQSPAPGGPTWTRTEIAESPAWWTNSVV